MKILAVSNQKGGVGKTAFSTHMAYAAHEKGLKVLLIDFDPQSNAGMMFEPQDESKKYLVTSDLFSEDAVDTPLEFYFPKLAIIRADKLPLAAINMMVSDLSLKKRPAQVLKAHQDKFDVCIIDCPPSMGVLLDAGLIAANQVLTPVKMGKFEMSGFADLLNNIKVIRTGGLNPRLKHIGSIPMKVNTRSSKQMQELSDFRKKYDKAVLPCLISEREAVQVAINEGRPVWEKIKGVSHKKTAQEWHEACDLILTILTA